MCIISSYACVCVHSSEGGSTQLTVFYGIHNKDMEINAMRFWERIRHSSRLAQHIIFACRTWISISVACEGT